MSDFDDNDEIMEHAMIFGENIVQKNEDIRTSVPPDSLLGQILMNITDNRSYSFELKWFNRYYKITAISDKNENLSKIMFNKPDQTMALSKIDEDSRETLDLHDFPFLESCGLSFDNMYKRYFKGLNMDDYTLLCACILEILITNSELSRIVITYISDEENIATSKITFETITK